MTLKIESGVCWCTAPRGAGKQSSLIGLQSRAQYLTVLRCMLCRNSFDGDDNAYWSYPTNKLYKKVGAPDVTLAYDSQGNVLQSSALSTARGTMCQD